MSKGELARHQKREHDVRTNAESYSYSGSEDEVQELLLRCFGEVEKVRWSVL